MVEENNNGRVRDAVLNVKLDTVIEKVDKLNGKLDHYTKRTERLEIEQARLDERVTSLRNVFAGVQAALTATIAGAFALFRKP